MMNKRNMMMAAVVVVVVVVVVVLYMYFGRTDNLQSVKIEDSEFFPDDNLTLDALRYIGPGQIPLGGNSERWQGLQLDAGKNAIKKYGKGNYRLHVTPCSSDSWGQTGEAVCQKYYKGKAPIYINQRTCSRFGFLNTAGTSSYICAEKVTKSLPPVLKCKMGYKEVNGRCYPEKVLADPSLTAPRLKCKMGYKEVNGRCYPEKVLADPSLTAPRLKCKMGYKEVNGRCYPEKVLADPSLTAPRAIRPSGSGGSRAAFKKFVDMENKEVHDAHVRELEMAHKLHDKEKMYRLSVDHSRALLADCGKEKIKFNQQLMGIKYL